MKKWFQKLTRKSAIEQETDELRKQKSELQMMSKLRASLGDEMSLDPKL